MHFLGSRGPARVCLRRLSPPWPGRCGRPVVLPAPAPCFASGCSSRLGHWLRLTRALRCPGVRPLCCLSCRALAVASRVRACHFVRSSSLAGLRAWCSSVCPSCFAYGVDDSRLAPSAFFALAYLAHTGVRSLPPCPARSLFLALRICFEKFSLPLCGLRSPLCLLASPRVFIPAWSCSVPASGPPLVPGRLSKKKFANSQLSSQCISFPRILESVKIFQPHSHIPL